MKYLVLVTLLFSLNTFADIPELKAWKHTCAELQESVKNYKEVTIVNKVALLFKKRTTIQHEAVCTSDQYKIKTAFKTADKRDCAVGELCQYAGSYSSSGSDYGYSGSDDSYSSSSSSSGWDSSSSSSGSDSSSGYGSSYNPPSSSYEGPSYSPPESGTRGSNYCPRCD